MNFKDSCSKTIKKYKYKLSNFVANNFTREKLKKIIFGSTTGRRMFRLYFLVLFIFALILYLPFSFKAFVEEGFGNSIKYINNEYVITIIDNNRLVPEEIVIHLNFFDIFFMSFSTFTDTGLSLFPLNDVFSVFGKIVMMLLIQIGGFGLMFFIFIFWKIFRRSDKISLNQALLAQSEKGNTKLGSTEKMLISSSILILIIELIFAFFYSLWLLLVPSYSQIATAITSPENGDLLIHTDNKDKFSEFYQNAANAFFAGFFHSVSVVNNAGFDIFGSSSLSAFRNGPHTLFLMVTAAQFIIGGIGFPIIFDIFTKWEWKKIRVVRTVNNKNIAYTKLKLQKNPSHRLSLFTKITLSTYLIVALLGIFFSFLFEATVVGGGKSAVWKDLIMFGDIDSSLTWYNKVVNVIFQSLSTRSAGYATFNNALLNPMTKWLNIVLMFIGGSASSTAGGIRVSTLAIILVVIYSKIRGSTRSSIFKRNLTASNISDSFIIIVIALILISLGGIILYSDVKGAYNFNGSSSHLKEFDNTYFTDAIFICSSAFGTTGLSTFNVYNLHWWSKIYLMFLMFIGQFGISTTILALKRNKVKENMFNYVSESIRIG